MPLHQKESPSASDPSQDANVFVCIYGDIKDEQPSIIVDENRDYLSPTFIRDLDSDYPPFNKIEKKYEKSIAEKIRENRARIIILLDTRGGYALFGNKVISATKTIKNSHAFVPRESGSMGSIIFNSAKTRHAVDSAEISYHMGAYKIPFLPIMVMSKKSKIDRHTDFLLDNTSPEYRKTMEAKLASAKKNRKNYDEQISFTGAELHKIGISHHSYATIMEMRNEITRISGIEHEAITKFLAISQMEKMYQEYEAGSSKVHDEAILRIGETWEEIKKI